MKPKRILALDEKTVGLIAAGEVVESPASIIKELIENSIDAGASSIVAEIRDGGRSYIRVTDDGLGIEEEDVELAFQRHTTSKIEDVSDFENLRTNGFRGEALSSISAVSKVQLITKTAESLHGTRLLLAGGSLMLREKTGAKDGTTLIVEDIFFNTPARKKFMKSAQAETAKITDIIIRLALANPFVKFKYINNNKVMLTTVGNSSLLDTIYSIYSKDLMNGLIKMDKKIGEIHLKGYIGHNTLMFSSRRYQHLFVNKRVIRGRELIYAVEEAYSSFIPSGNYPGFILDIQLPPALIDVNIHPNKLDIKFDRDQRIREVVREMIRDTLNELVMIPKIRISAANKKDPEEKEIKNLFIEDILKAKETKKEIEKKQGEKKEEKMKEERVQPFAVKEEEEEFQNSLLPPEDEEWAYQVDFDYRAAKMIGVLFDTYFVAEYRSSLYLIDQHAAHERVLFEKYREALRRNTIASQGLLIPLQINLPLILSGMEEEIIVYLSKKGFDADLFGNHVLMVRSIPAIFTMEQGRAFIEEIINIKAEEGRKATLLNDRIALKACKAAIKANDRLHSEEILSILKELDGCRNKYACPHGRPIIIEISKYEIEKMFKRVLK